MAFLLVAVTPKTYADISESDHIQAGQEALNSGFKALEGGNDKVATHHFEEAATLFSKALEANPDDTIILMNRGTAYIGLNQNELALADFDVVLSLDPNFVFGYEGKAMVYEAMGDSQKVEEMEEIISDIYEALNAEAQELAEEDGPAPYTNYST